MIESPGGGHQKPDGHLMELITAPWAVRSRSEGDAPHGRARSDLPSVPTDTAAVDETWSLSGTEEVRP
jgi:hypothetical protein